MPSTENTTLAYLRLAKARRGAHVDPVDAWYDTDFVIHTNGATPNGAVHANGAVPWAWPMDPDFDITVVEERTDEWPMPVRCLHGDPSDWE